MTDLFPDAKPAVSIAGQIAEVERELAMRRAAYPRWIEQKRITQAAADARVISMEAVLATLRGLPR